MRAAEDTGSLPRFRLEEFDGPLDLLLHEVRRQNVAIEKIAMAPIVARYLEYVRTAVESRLILDVEWLHMAATLIHWKSRALLSSDATGEAEADAIRQDLIQQLLGHAKQAAQELAQHRSLEESRFSRARLEEFSGEPANDQLPETPFVSVWDMIQQARDVGHWIEKHRHDRRHWRATFNVEQDDITVGEMIEYLQSRLDTGTDVKVDGSRLLQDQATGSRRACLFLGMLEMVRDQQLQIEQNEGFGRIWLTRSSAGR